ncbi:MAG: hypothetical protein HRT87_04735 [Legionellales bacterium]|nr:hypothetical protein [Legionellales bacterium]
MVESIKQLKKERPDLVEEFEAMDREQLLKQCYLECIDAINMERRVSVFMELCTMNLSKTNYTEASIRSMVGTKQEFDIENFCDTVIQDAKNDQEIADEIWNCSSKTK